MAKTKVTTAESDGVSSVTTVNEPETTSISLLTNDFGREDLNELRDKINELIKRG